MNPTQAAPNLETLFDDMTFPANKADVIDHAQDKEAAREAMDVLQVLPSREYSSLQDLNRALVKCEGLPGHENQWPSASAHHEEAYQEFKTISKL